ncbi:MAG: porin family protein [bacterium]
MNRFAASLLAIGAFALVTGAQAQSHWGGLIGVNRTTIDLWFEDPFTDISPRTTIAIGGVLQYRLSGRLALQFQPMYLQKGVKRSYEDEVAGHVEFVSKLSYLELPALFKYSLLSKGAIRPFVLAGPAAGTLLSSKYESKVAGETFVTDDTDGRETLDLGIVFGGGLSIVLGNKEVFFEGRYDYGLSKLEHNFEGPGGSHNRALQFIAGIVFARGKK